MFYSQVILAKQGPLGKAWLAAHWGDKKISRPQVFATDITTTVDSIVNPSVPLALRVRGHLLFGVVLIYSRKVKYLMHDCHEAMVKIKMAFRPGQQQQLQGGEAGADGAGAGGTRGAIDMEPPRGQRQADAVGGPTTRSSGRAEGGNSNLNVANFGEYHEVVFEPVVYVPAGGQTASVIAGGFQIPFDLHDETAAEDWIPAELDETQDFLHPDDGDDDSDTGEDEDGTEGRPSKRRRRDTDAKVAADGENARTPDVAEMLSQREEMEWAAFDPEEEEEEEKSQEDEQQKGDEENKDALGQPKEDEQAGQKSTEGQEDDKEAELQQGQGIEDEKENEPAKEDEDSHISDLEAARATNDSMASDPALRRASVIETDDVGPQGPLDVMEEAEFPMPDDGAVQGASTLLLDEDGDADMQSASKSRDLGLNLSDDEAAFGSVKGLDAGSVKGLDVSRESAADNKAGATESSGPPDIAAAVSEEDSAPRRVRRTPRKRRKRKVVVDNDETELSNQHIKEMLADTSDIVSGTVFHPATWVPGQRQGKNKAASRGATDKDRLFAYLAHDQMFARPAVGDDGMLDPDLLDLWARNTGPVVGKAFGYRKREERKAPEEEEQESVPDETIPMAEEEPQGQENVQVPDETIPMTEEEPQGQENVEVPDETIPMAEEEPQGQENVEGADALVMPLKEDASASEDEAKKQQASEQHAHESSLLGIEEGAVLEPPVFGDEAAPLLGDLEEDQNFPPQNDDIPMAIGEEEPKLATADGSGEESDEQAGDGTGSLCSEQAPGQSILDLGHVNDLKDMLVEDEDREEEDREARQEAGDEAVASTSKWHKHTLKVYGVLRQSIAGGGLGDDSGKPKPSQISYNGISKGCNRRTAAGVFFELLQLKTWDYIELDQDESYADIKVSAGIKFGEDPPSS